MYTCMKAKLTVEGKALCPLFSHPQLLLFKRSKLIGTVGRCFESDIGKREKLYEYMRMNSIIMPFIGKLYILCN